MLPERDGSPVFGEWQCVDYMHLTSGVPKIFCAVHEYEETIDLIASGVISGSPLENMQEVHSITRQILEDIEKGAESKIFVGKINE